MEILQLRYFCDAAESQNFSKTAKKFGVPPSNISQCIKRLESELGTELFSRRANSLFLNEKGKVFFEKTAQALELLDEAKTAVSEKPDIREIRICITANRRIVMLAVESFRKQYPQYGIIISHKYEENEEYDIVISDELFKVTGMENCRILSEEIALAVKRDNELAKKETVEIEDIRNENFISMNSETSLSRITKKFCSQYGFEPKNVIQLDDPYYMRMCVELGLGVAFVPVVSWKGLFSDEIVLKRIDGFCRNICAFRKTKGYGAKVTERFLNELLVVCKKESEKNC